MKVLTKMHLKTATSAEQLQPQLLSSDPVSPVAPFPTSSKNIYTPDPPSRRQSTVSNFNSTPPFFGTASCLDDLSAPVNAAPNISPESSKTYYMSSVGPNQKRPERQASFFPGSTNQNVFPISRVSDPRGMNLMPEASSPTDVFEDVVTNSSNTWAAPCNQVQAHSMVFLRKMKSVSFVLFSSPN